MHRGADSNSRKGGGHCVNGDDSRLVKLTSHFNSVFSVSSFVCLLVLKAPFTFAVALKTDTIQKGVNTIVVVSLPL